MIYLRLFWDFFKIGLFTIGGGYAMLPLVRQEIVGVYITEESLLNIVGVAESTPGPFAVNLATFVGMQTGMEFGVGFAFLAAFAAVLGVVLPSFIIILIISALLNKFSQSQIVKTAFTAVRPVVCGLIFSAVVVMLSAVILPQLSLNQIKSEGFAEFNYISLILFLLFGGLSFVKIKKKNIHPLILIGISAVVGILLFGVLGL